MRRPESDETVMSTFTRDPDALGANVLSVALIGPEEQHRKAVARVLAESQASVTREFHAYPELDDVTQILEADYDVIIVELDSNPESALDLVEHICGHSSVSVMVYSAQSDPELLVRCMRAGAREFLTQPISQGTMAEALVRASVRRPSVRKPKKVGGKLLVFLGTKGGSGVTTLATNFALALAQESSQKTLLIDLVLPLGDAGLELGVTAQFSTAHALQNYNRLDANFLSTLLTKHSSGLQVLVGPDRYTPAQLSEEALERLLTVARQEFDYVVVDAGSSIGTTGKALFDAAATVYLVTQVSISQLRNSNRLIAEFFRGSPSKLEIVLNRFTPRSLGLDEESITKALTMPVKWKVPSDYPAARKAQDMATPLVLEDSAVARSIRQMARVACSLPPTAGKKKRFGLFG